MTSGSGKIFPCIISVLQCQDSINNLFYRNCQFASQKHKKQTKKKTPPFQNKTCNVPKNSNINPIYTVQTGCHSNDLQIIKIPI